VAAQSSYTSRIASIRAVSGSTTWWSQAYADPSGPNDTSKDPSDPIFRDRSSKAVEPSGVELGV
jgi:hypothetical protein